MYSSQILVFYASNFLINLDLQCFLVWFQIAAEKCLKLL